MSDHATLAPSARVRWANCPGSVREEAKYPEQPSGPAAIDGTHSHTLLEKCLTTNLTPQDFIGKELEDHEGKFVVDAERADRVSVAVGYIVRRVRELGGPGVRILSEQRVDPHLLTGRTDQSGTVDIRLIAPGFIEIIDYKDGVQPVPAEGNLQMLQYAVGSVAELMLQYDMKLIPDCTIRLTIVQPKLRLKGLDPISSWEFSSAKLQEEVLKLVKEGQACDDPNAPLVPGDEQCKYCRAKGCAARASHVMDAVGLMFGAVVNPLEGANVTVLADGVAQQAAGKNPNEMSDQQLKELLEAAPLIRQVLEAAEIEALRRFEAGQSIEGLKVVRGRGSRSWALPEAEMAEKLKKMGIPKDTLWSTKLITPAQAESATWEKRDGTKVQLTERQKKTLQGEYIKKSDGKLTVVSASDERPSAMVNAAPMFSAVEPALPSWLV